MDDASGTGVQAEEKSLRKIYVGGGEGGEPTVKRAPFTKWGAKRLIDQHLRAVAYNRRLAELLTTHKEELVKGNVPWSLKGNVRALKVDRIEAAVAAFVAAAGGAYLLHKTRDPSALVAASFGGGYAIAKVRGILARLRRSPELAATRFVAQKGLDIGQRGAHGELIDAAVASLKDANKGHSEHLAALRDLLTRRGTAVTTERAAKVGKVRTRTEEKVRKREERDRAAAEKKTLRIRDSAAKVARRTPK